MKKIYTFISIITMILLAAGCTNEIDSPVREKTDGTSSDGIITVRLSVPVSPDTKTSLGSKNGNTYPVLWGASDVITLNGSAATSFTPGDGNTTATATFHLSSLSSPYNFLYCGVPGLANQVTFPATQNYVPGGFDPAAMPMYASLASRSDNVTFSHVGALLKFSLTGDKKIDSVTLTAADGDKSLSGDFTVGATAGILNGNLTPISGGASLIYSFGGHQQLSDAPFEFYIAIPAGTYEGGITLDVVDNSSGHMTIKVMDSDATKTIDAGKVREFENVVYVPDKVTNLMQIYDLATFRQFVDAVADGNKTLNACLTLNASTLNLSSIAASFEPIEDYKGIFDGNGKTITGLTKPMFADLMGVVKNLSLNSAIEATDPEDVNWGIFAKQLIPSTEIDDIAGLQNCTAQGSITWTPSSIVESNCQIGGLLGNNKGGSISSCINQATVTFANNGETNTCEPSIGGIVGRSQKGGELKTQGDISNCSNSGAVVCDANFDSNIYIGGVLGFQVEKAENIRGCTNSGTVTVTENASTSKRLQIGGVVGLGKGAIESCTNLSGGVVTTEACSVTGYICQGGVVGRMTNPSDTYTGLTNAGTLNVAASGSNNAYIGGVVGLCNEGATITGFTNNGTINCNSSHKGEMYIGGIAGCSRVILSGNNKGRINVSGFVGKTGKVVCVGGVVGQNDDEVTADNEGNVVLTSDSNTYYDTFVGGIVGRAKANVTSCTNSGSIYNDCPLTKSGQFLEIGGIVGYSISSALISNCCNTGHVANTANSAGYLYVGGIVAEADNDIVSCVNSGDVSNSGQATTAYADGKVYHVEVGGISGHNAEITMASCSNEGAVSNSGNSGAGIFVGGLSGHSVAGTFETCTNSGAVSNSGSANNSGLPVDVAIGGMAGYLDGDNTLTGTSSLFNSNSGTVVETSTSTYVGMGGISGLVNGEGTDLSYVKNLSAGNITYSGNTRTQSYIGGVLGCAMTAFTMGYASNAGDLDFEALTINYAMWIGGVIGGFHEGMRDTACSFTGLENYGTISCPNSDSGANMAPDKKSRTAYSYIGGISGVGECSAKEFLNCTNSGAIVVHNQMRTRVGGILGYSEINPSGCVNNGPINYCRYNTISMDTKYKSEVGGVVGYMDIETPTDLTNDATVRATGSSPNSYVGGIVGLVGNSTTGFLRCNVGSSRGTQKSISGASEGSFGSTAAGLFCADDSANEWDFTGCKVKSGTKCQNVEVTADNLEESVIGRNHPTSITNLPSIVASF